MDLISLLILIYAIKSAIEDARNGWRTSKAAYMRSADARFPGAPKSRRAARALRHDTGYWAGQAFHGFPAARHGLGAGWYAGRQAQAEGKAGREKAKAEHLEARAHLAPQVAEFRARQQEALRQIYSLRRPAPGDGIDGTYGEGNWRKADRIKRERAARADREGTGEGNPGAAAPADPVKDYGPGPWLLHGRSRSGRKISTLKDCDTETIAVWDPDDLKRRLDIAASDPDLEVRVTPLPPSDGPSSASAPGKTVTTYYNGQEGDAMTSPRKEQDLGFGPPGSEPGSRKVSDLALDPPDREPGQEQPPGHEGACPPGTYYFRNRADGKIYAAHPDGTAHEVPEQDGEGSGCDASDAGRHEHCNTPGCPCPCHATAEPRAVIAGQVLESQPETYAITEGNPSMATAAADTTYTDQLNVLTQIRDDAEQEVASVRRKRMLNHLDVLSGLRLDGQTLSEAAAIDDALKKQEEAAQEALEAAETARTGLIKRHGGIQEAVDSSAAPLPAEPEFYAS